MSEIHRRRSRRYKFELSFGNDRRPSQKSGTRRENRNTPDSPDLSPSIPDDRGYVRFRVFISRQNLGQSGNSKILDRLGFSRHMKTRLYPRELFLSNIALSTCVCRHIHVRMRTQLMKRQEANSLDNNTWSELGEQKPTSQKRLLNFLTHVQLPLSKCTRTPKSFFKRGRMPPTKDM